MLKYELVDVKKNTPPPITWVNVKEIVFLNLILIVFEFYVVHILNVTAVKCDTDEQLLF